MHETVLTAVTPMAWMAPEGGGFRSRALTGRPEADRELPRIRVLIVEDESLVALDMEQILLDGGYEVLAVVDTERDAVLKAERLQPDIVLMDIRLRDGDGVAAAIAIRQRRDIPVIFVSGNTDAATLGRVAQAQPAGFVRKPFIGPELVSALDALSDRLAEGRFENSNEASGLNSITPQQIKLIKSSFAAIYSTREESARLFYDYLFTIAPDFRRLFKTDMRSQGNKLMDTLAMAITVLHHSQSLDHVLYDTSRRHVGYGVTPAHFDLVGVSLLWMLEKQLGKDFTPDVETAWTQLYNAVAAAMQRIGAGDAVGKSP